MVFKKLEIPSNKYYKKKEINGKEDFLSQRFLYYSKKDL